MTAETAVTRVHAFVEAAGPRVGEGYVLGVAGSPIDDDVMHQLLFDDVRALLKIIAETCDQHEACSLCEAPLCEVCGIGEIHTCADFHLIVHCPDCVMECRACRDEAQGVRDAEYDREAERAL